MLFKIQMHDSLSTIFSLNNFPTILNKYKFLRLSQNLWDEKQENFPERLYMKFNFPQYQFTEILFQYIMIHEEILL